MTRILCTTMTAIALVFIAGAQWPQGAVFKGPAAHAMQPDEAADMAAEQAAEHAADQAADNAAEQAAEQAADNAAENAGEDAAEEAAEQAADQAADRAAEDAAEAAFETASEIAEAAGEQAAAAAAEQAAEQAAEAALETASEAAGGAQGPAETPAGAVTLPVNIDPPANPPGLETAAQAQESASAPKPGPGSGQASPSSNASAARIDFDAAGERILRDERVFVLPLERAGELDAQDAVIEATTLEGLGLLLVRVETPGGSDPAPGALPAGGGVALDYNHVYTPEQRDSGFEGAAGATPVSFVRDKGPDTARSGFAPKIGLIDTDVQADHAALKNSNIHKADFSGANDRPVEHGTSVASALVGRDGAFSGLLPEARLYAASVFVAHPSEGTIASTASLVEALDWMVANDVAIVNMSLAGPPNKVLETAIARAAQSGVTIIAAAGNGGPAARPRFPAAYDNVIAVTAVSRDRRVYRHAVRGPHIDFAGPGVDILLASSQGGYANVSGTSIAAPFITGAVALRCAAPARCADHETLIGALAAEALDLGDEGFDVTYGNGLILP